MNAEQGKLDYADCVTEWLIELGQQEIDADCLEEAAVYTALAATNLSRQNRKLISIGIEKNLLSIARRLSDHTRYVSKDDDGFDDTSGKNCLHVLDEALPAGGLTAMAVRWISNDTSGRINHVVLLSQEVSIPQELIEACKKSGGKVIKLDPELSLVARAARLRTLAASISDMLVLHVGVSDVISGIAFGVEGGVPVMIVNHAAHIYWSCSSIADLVVNCRGSELEKEWTEHYRNSKSAIVPIPLQEVHDSAEDPTENIDRKRSVKKELGLPSESILILTVGASFKYFNFDDVDFVKTYLDILNEVPNAILIVVGARPDSRWSEASKLANFRIKVLGSINQNKLAQIRKATDIYVESFPFGSTTSLLEAALHGIPVVLAPANCPPPFGTDGIAIDTVVSRPISFAQYKEYVISLCKNRELRDEAGRLVKDSVEYHHTGEGWRGHLAHAVSLLPARHKINQHTEVNETENNIYGYWTKIVSTYQYPYEECFEHMVIKALDNGVKPHLTDSLVSEYKKYYKKSTCHSMRIFLLELFFNKLLPILTPKSAGKLFKLQSFFFRSGLGKRISEKLANLFAKKDLNQSWYAEYRNIKN